MTDIPSVTPGAIYDLNFFMVERPDGWRASCEFNTDLFSGETITDYLLHFQVVLEGVADNPRRRISEFPLMRADECRRLLVDFNATASRYPADATIAELFEARADVAPAAPALLSSAGGVLSYADLDARAGRLAHRLIQAGMGPDSVVGVALRRSPELVVALLGILKAGAAYLPLDPGYPEDRLAFMVEDAGAALVVVDEAVLAKLPAGTPQLTLDDRVASAGGPIGGKPHRIRPLGPDDLAYVIYTSGSTGRPKGVMNTHRGLINRLAWFWAAEPYLRGEVACHKTSPNFVDALTELLGPLLQGVPVLVATPEEGGDPRLLAALLCEHRVTRLTLVPSLLDVLLDATSDLTSLRVCVCSGEVLPRQLTDRFHSALPAARLWNFYGASEANGDSVATLVEAAAGQVPIGRPIANTQAYVLDQQRHPMPVGVPGELYIGGIGLARGYLNRSDLTEERFIANPFGEGRLYRTGDLARWWRDGQLDYLGRTDRQIKLRGFRIELGEIETALRHHPDVAEAAIVADTGAGTAACLRAYVVVRPAVKTAHENLVAELRDHLARTLPVYMHPATITRLDALPRTPTGKIDRKALVEPESEFATVPAPVAIGDDIEGRLAEIWGSILGAPPQDRSANFFEIGGHSLLAVRMLARVEAVFGKTVRLAALFQAPTLQALAGLLREARAAAHEYQVVKVQQRGTLTPIMSINNDESFFGLTRELGYDRPFLAIQLHDPSVPKELPAREFEDIAADYVQIVRRAQPRGPYILLGLRVAGCVAYEAARQLRRQGEEVPLLVVINACAPGYLASLTKSRTLLGKLSDHWQNSARALAKPAGTRAQLRDLSSRPGDMQGLFSGTPVGAAASWDEAHLLAAMQRYRPKPYAGRALLLHDPSQIHGRFVDTRLGWSDLLTGQVEIFPTAETGVGTAQNAGAALIAQHISRILAETNPMMGW